MDLNLPSYLIFPLYLAGALIVLLTLYKVITRILRKKRRAKYPKNVVILHQFPRSKHLPTVSPFSMKLETWLRMTNIPYQNEFGLEFSPTKSQVPWITYNNEIVQDSQFCMEYLSKKFDVDLNSHLNDEENSIARAFFKMTEESLRWQIGFRRYIYDINPSEHGLPWIVIMYYKSRVHKAVWLQGYGRHSKEEVHKIGKDDLKAINNFIGNKKYLMGDKICNEDASLFGILCQFVFSDRGPMNKFIIDECPSIVRYVNTIKETYWKDWNEQLG